MFLRHLEGLIDTFTDSNRRNHNDEFAPTVMLVQFIHCLDIGVCFTDTSFHLKGEVETTFQLRRRCNQVCSLNLLNMFQNQTVIQRRNKFGVRPTSKILLLRKVLLIGTRTFVHHIGRSQIGLPRKDIHHSLCCICLEFLMLEL